MTEPFRPRAIMREAPYLKQAGLFAPKDYKRGDLLFSDTAVVLGTDLDLDKRLMRQRDKMIPEEWDDLLERWLMAARQHIPTMRWFVEEGTMEGMNYPNPSDNILDREAYSTFVTDAEYLLLVGKEVDGHQWTWEEELELRHLRRVIEDSIPVTVDYLGGLSWAVSTLTGLINHACHPNAYMELIEEGTEGYGVATVTIKVFAVKDIKEGEEITRSYQGPRGCVAHCLDKLRHQRGFHCKCNSCERAKEDVGYRILRNDVYDLKTQLETQPPQMAGHRLRDVGLLLDGYSLLDISHEVEFRVYIEEAKTAALLGDTIRAHYFTTRQLHWLGHCAHRPMAMSAVRVLSNIQRNRRLDSAIDLGQSVWDYYEMSQENLEEVIFSMAPGRSSDTKYRLLQVVDGVVEEVPDETVNKMEAEKREMHERQLEERRLAEEKERQDLQHRVQAQTMTLEELTQSIEGAPQGPSKKKKKSKKKAKKGPDTTNEESEPLVDDTATTESLNQIPVGKSAVQNLDDSTKAIEKKDVNEHDQQKIKTDAKSSSPPTATPSPAEKANGLTGMSLDAGSGKSNHDEKSDLARVNKWTNTTERSMLTETNATPDPDLTTTPDTLTQTHTWTDTDEDSLTMPRYDQHTKTDTVDDVANDNSWTTVTTRKKTTEERGLPPRTSSNLQNKAIGPRQAPVTTSGRRQPQTLSNWQDQTTTTAVAATAVDHRTDQTSSSWQARIDDLLQGPSAPHRRRQGQTASSSQDETVTKSQQAPVTAANRLAKTEIPPGPFIGPKEDSTQAKPVLNKKRNDRRAKKALKQKVSKLEQEVEELKSRNQFLETVAGIVAEEDHIRTTQPFKSPFGAKDGTSKSEWLASKANKRSLANDPRDLGHLLAAKDGINAPLLGFVLKERRDSACGRVEGDKVFVERGRPRGHTVSNDGSKMDCLKEAEV
ncbi:hypothetical protein PV08_07694 [Exophiala spinifera]|uniref:Histone-lysine N-methyltransferase SET5 n=1 Tax=Exophiala spinifera TaxID=91928 RepID=A0A0D2BUI5_9EURO|nr:uncharacterized protein PV08_07694 [Exophiala spinifera]KIW14909.1 hypothetical protein PV08_07694 [Exophiala spinifera]